MESADTHLLLAMMMTMLRFYQAMAPPVSPLILRGSRDRCILILQDQWALPPSWRWFILGESARKNQNQIVLRRRAKRQQPTTTSVWWWCNGCPDVEVWRKVMSMNLFLHRQLLQSNDQSIWCWGICCFAVRWRYPSIKAKTEEVSRWSLILR